MDWCAIWCAALQFVRHHTLVVREKSQWRECQSRLESDLRVEIETFHRNDQPDDVRACIDGKYPAVVMRGDDGVVSMFMTASEIDACGASPEKFADEISRRLAR